MTEGMAVGSTEAPGARPSEIQITVLGSLLYLAGAGVLYAMPAYLDHLTAVYGLSASQAGFLSGGETLSIATSALLTGLFIHRFGRKLALVCIVACVLGDLASNFAGRLDVLFGLRLLTGFCGEGPAYALGFSVLARSRRPENAYGWAFVLCVAVSAAAIAASPWLNGLGPSGVLLPIVAACALAGPSGLWMPGPEQPAPHAAAGKAGLDLKSLWLLAGMALWFAAPGMFWAFAVRVSSGHGVADADIVRAVALSIGLGLGGSFIPIVLGDRAGRVGPILAATAALALSAVAVALVTQVIPLMLALAAFNGAWNLASVYQLSSLAAQDRSGRYTGLGAFAQLAGQAIGPPIGGIVIDRWGAGTVPWGVGAFAVAGAAVFLAVAAAFRRGRPA